MVYNFQLHRLTLMLITALLGVGGGLLFFSGLLVGISWQLPPATPPIAATTTAAAGQPGDTAASLATQVSLPAGFAAPAGAGPAPAAPQGKTPAPLVKPAASPSALPPAGSELPQPLSEDAVTLPGQAVPESPPAAPPDDPPPSLRPASSREAGFALQVGAFSVKENSEKLVQELTARGFAPYLVRTATRTRQSVESVRIGRFASRADAIAAGAELARAEGIRTMVVRASGFVD